jgi:hypothetical protein
MTDCVRSGIVHETIALASSILVTGTSLYSYKDTESSTKANPPVVSSTEYHRSSWTYKQENGQH